MRSRQLSFSLTRRGIVFDSYTQDPTIQIILDQASYENILNSNKQHAQKDFLQCLANKHILDFIRRVMTGFGLAPIVHSQYQTIIIISPRRRSCEIAYT